MKNIYILAFCLSTLNLQAQHYYPGGMGSSSLLLWLNAANSSSLTMNASNQVSSWVDQSPNGFNFQQAAAANSPVYGAAGSPSGKPALTFTSTSSQYLSLASMPSTISFTGGVSSFAMVSYSAPQTVQGWQRIYDFGNGQASNNFMMGRNSNTAQSYYEGWNGGAGDQTYTTPPAGAIVNLSENLYEAVQQAGAAGSLQNVAHYVAGSSLTASGAAGSSQTHLPNSITRTSNFIGRSNWAADNYFSGTMSELLIYNTAFNTTQRVILENYLSAAWNQTVSVSGYTAPSATTYRTNLVGIGYTSATDNFLTDVAGSTDGLGFSSGTTAADFLQNAGYVMAAHNAQSNTVIANATVAGIKSSSPMTRWNRSWDVQKTGGTAAGALTLSFNFSDYNSGLGAPSATSTYALLYNSTDGTFATGANQLISTTSTTVAGNTVSFNLPAANLANGYYTLLYSSSPIILPVVLGSFTATRQGSSSSLDWNVTEQSGMSRFDIQRAGDGIHFSSIGSVAATSNSSDAYEFTDASPLTGTSYYRLAMVNEDGSIAYSGIRTVNQTTRPEVSLNIYPNPATDVLHVVVPNPSGLMTIRLIDARGQVLLQSVTAASATDIRVSGLAHGVYWITVTGTGISYTNEFLKN